MLTTIDILTIAFAGGIIAGIPAFLAGMWYQKKHNKRKVQPVRVKRAVRQQPYNWKKEGDFK